MSTRNKTYRSKRKDRLSTKEFNNKKLVLQGLAIILYLLLVIALLTSVKPFLLTKPQKTYQRIYRPFINNFELWINDTWVPVNQTILVIPEQNYSLTFGEVKKSLINEGFPTFWPEYDIIIDNATLKKDAGGTPYYVGKAGIENPLNWDWGIVYEAMVTFNPSDIRDYFYKPFYLFFDVFSTGKDKVKEQLSYQEVINYWNSTPFVPYVFKNSTKFLPLIAPEDKDYYGAMALEGQLLLSRLKSNNEWQNNVKCFFAWWINPKPKYSFIHDLTGFILNASLSIDTAYYNATITLESILDINDKLVVGYELVNSSLLFYDKTSHTRIKILKGFEIPWWYAIRIAAPGSSLNGNNDFLLLLDHIDYKWASVSVVTILICKKIVASPPHFKRRDVGKKS